jgi:predicted RNA-binding protein YlqC (UPF0109 family)
MVFSFLKNILGGGSREDEQDGPVPAAASEPKATPSAPPSADDADEGTGATTADIEQFVLYVTQALVDKPDEIRLETVEKGRNTTINIRCAKPDTGKIIGRSGKTISAIRALAAGAAGKAGKKVAVEVLD